MVRLFFLEMSMLGYTSSCVRVLPAGSVSTNTTRRVHEMGQRSTYCETRFALTLGWERARISNIIHVCAQPSTTENISITNRFSMEG